MDILNKIIILRDKVGMKQEDVAKYLGISKSSYRRKEKGDTEFTLKEFEKLLQTFNVTYSDLMDIEFPIVHEEKISADLLDCLERVNSECYEVSGDWNKNKEYYNRIQRALTPVLEEKMHSFDFPDLNLDTITVGTTVKEVKIDIRAERLIDEAFRIQKRLANAIFGAEM